MKKSNLYLLHPREYRSYCMMKTRCNNPKAADYYWYGGRGIKVCARWNCKYGFGAFLEDLGPRPEGMTLNRIRNNGNYTPTNCEWATKLEQAQNTRRTKLSATKAKLIRSLLGKVLQVELARRFGIAGSGITKIKQNLHWRI